MPRKEEITEDVRLRIVDLHEAGNGYRLISKTLDVHPSTVRQIIYKWRRFSTVATLPRCGRPAKKTPKAQRRKAPERLLSVPVGGSVPGSSGRRVLEQGAEPQVAPDGPSPPCVHLSSGPQQKNKIFYEFRTYCIRPDQNAAFLKLTSEKIHLRTAHSELVGYWSVEYGGLNQVFHIWKYDSYAQRAAVRAALAQDPSWVSEYLSKMLPMLTYQDNEVVYLVPWSSLQSPPQEGGVYELVSYQMRPGGPAVWGNAFQAAVTAHDAPGYAKLVGAFHSEFGQLNRVHALWWFESADRRAELRQKAHTDARVVAAVRNSFVNLDSQKNKLMFPCLFSPMK